MVIIVENIRLYTKLKSLVTGGVPRRLFPGRWLEHTVTTGAVHWWPVLPPGDPLSRPVPRTYADLMRGPLVLGQEDPVLIAAIRGLLDGPSSEPYNLRNPERKDSSQNGQQAYLLELIGNRVSSL